MFCGVSTQVTDPDGQTIPQTEHSKLGDGILLEELDHELLCISQCEEISIGAQVLFQHGLGKIEDENEMADYPSLQRRRVPQ